MDRRHRLTSSRDFARVMKEGRRSSSGVVVVHILRTDEARPARVGITATRATGSSVRRNRAKRLLREAARARLAEIPAGADVVISAREALPGSTFQEVDSSLRAALTRADVA